MMIQNKLIAKSKNALAPPRNPEFYGRGELEL
jgi:hypothetical protein